MSNRSRGRTAKTTRDRRIARTLSQWFARQARELPWRTTPRDPYRSLVSEAMLQQTQVARVLEKFEPFVTRFPTVRALAKADEHDVLAAWSGLGYYRRARHLHAAAKAIVERHAGNVPSDVDSLLALPGIGRYTAGAIASIVFGESAPIVDGNVRRVLVRLEGVDLDERAAERWSWERAEQLVSAASDPAAFNEGLMELGALICTPKSPACDECPLRRDCIAYAQGLQEELPRPRKRGPVREIHHGVLVVRDGAGRLLVERRPSKGLWAGMWQAPTIEGDHSPTAAEVRKLIGVRQSTLRERFTHQTSHRTVQFSVWEAVVQRVLEVEGRHWIEPRELAGFALANPHRRILLGEEIAKPSAARLEKGRE